MSEISLYEAQKKKLEGLCDEHDLTYSFKKEQYPITLTIRPTQGMDAQLSMLESAEEGADYRSADAYMQWIFKDGKITTKVGGGTFAIGEELRTKIKNILTKMIAFWQQYFFRDVIEKGSLEAGMMPVINEAEAHDAPESVGADSYDDGGDEEEYPTEDIDLDEALTPDDDDAEIAEAISIVRMEGKATASLLQRRMNIGYTKASQLLDALENRGVIGPFNGSQPREVLPYDEPDDEGDLPEEDNDNG